MFTHEKPPKTCKLKSKLYLTINYILTAKNVPSAKSSIDNIERRQSNSKYHHEEEKRAGEGLEASQMFNIE